MDKRILPYLDCTGCAACANACQKSAITMIPDSHEGFLYPNINVNKCVQCGLCEKVCPVLIEQKNEKRELHCYAAMNTDLDIRKHSSSGGVFYLLAERILSSGGVVFGAAMSDDNRLVRHIMVDSMDDLPRIMGSKYLQSEIGQVYSQVKTELKKGREVLFSGCPCQINGLRKFLEIDYQNLFCVDVICHGTPSQKVWAKYLNYVEERYHAKIMDVSFRYKSDTWHNFCIRRLDSKNKEIIIPHREDYYMRFFLQNYCLRESCYNCSSKQNKQSDITLGDFWGIERFHPEMNDGLGTSLVITRTEKGENLFDVISNQLLVKAVSYNEAVEYNSSEYDSVPRPMERDVFFDDLDMLCYEELKKKYAKDLYDRESWEKSVKYRIRRWIKMRRWGVNIQANNNRYYLRFIIT